MYFVGTFHRNYFPYIIEIFQMQLFASLVFPYTIILFSFVYIAAIMPLLSIYRENTCILCHSFCQNDHFTTMGHATKLTFCHKILFFAELKCVCLRGKFNILFCLHKYVNNSIYVFEPKFTKSRPMLPLRIGHALLVAVHYGQFAWYDGLFYNPHKPLPQN